MQNVFIVDAYLITASGVFSHASGFPKAYASASYDYDVDKALRVATGAFANAWGAACVKEGMQIQHITLTDMTGFQLDRKVVGELPADPEPEPEEETTEETTEETGETTEEV